MYKARTCLHVVLLDSEAKIMEKYNTNHGKVQYKSWKSTIQNLENKIYN